MREIEKALRDLEALRDAKIKEMGGEKDCDNAPAWEAYIEGLNDALAILRPACQESDQI